MKCECCTNAKQSPDHRQFDPACLFCGARLIRRLSQFGLDRAALSERRRRVLADWMAYGHAESELRAWAKSPDCFAPDGPEEKSESEPRSKTKRR